nr:hypothetical protein [Tanacetum cinerariifolium]
MNYEEEEEHPSPADSIPPPSVHHVTARMFIKEQPHTPVWSEAEIDRLLAIPSPPPSPLFPCPTYPLGYRAAMIRLRDEIPSTSHLLSSGTLPSGTPPLLPIPLPTPSPPLNLPSTSHKADVLEVTLPPRKRLCIALGLIYEVGESSFAAAARPTGGFKVDYGFIATLDDEIKRDPKRDVGYRITDTWDEMLVGMPGAPATDDTKLGGSTSFKDRGVTGDRPQETSTIHRGTKTAEDTTDLGDSTSEAAGTSKDLAHSPMHRRRPKMTPKRTTRSTPATTTTTNTTSVNDAQLKALINQGIANALAVCDADRSRNGKDNHDSRMGVRRQAPPAHECTYQD